ncbi:uncharacterized protein J4E87_003518 [Alternaria ethzedia]|uniref:uncharacterized protein n=1 Tax=Alternaria ethzedia TaxID=181014 RepID=UPI0020C39202|nr:uncharacterized protein J4E87_003518 [Alternaria ethzedia]KAI4629256.1 hypothetical protein J4E87_003518 [Alternaria ethzedia]
MNTTLVHGWVSSPNERGTIDILWSCIVTVFLCSWSSLFLNVPDKNDFRSYMSTKLPWVAFTIFFPELLASFAQVQYLSARHSVSRFHKSGYTDWTITHAFFADMGGFVLEPPDYPRFPVNAHQVHYLVEHGFVDFPKIHRDAIKDKNKADAFVRILTSVQVLWFALQCIGRAAQHLAISMLELDVVAIVLCTFPTHYYLFHKPLDVDTPVTLKLVGSLRLADVLALADPVAAKQPFKQTPLDFANPPSDPLQVLDPIVWGFEHLFRLGNDAKHVPITRFKNTARMNPGKVVISEGLVASALAFSFIGIHFFAWNFHFPTVLERDLSRGACVVLFAVGFTFGILWLLITWQLPNLCRWAGIPQTNTVTEFIDQIHPFFQYLLVMFHMGAYGLARTFIIVEGFAGLRALPASSYRSVEWSDLLPHI